MEKNIMCHDEYCKCLQHMFLRTLKKESSSRSFLEKLENYHELTIESGFTLLHHAARYGNTTIIQHLIDEGCKVNAQDAFGNSPLMLAIAMSNLKTIEVLLKNGANIYITDYSGKNNFEICFSQLCFAYLEVSRVIANILFDRINDDFMKANVTQFLLNANHVTKLAMITFGKAEIVKFILQNGFNINSQESKFGYTALHQAIRLKLPESAKRLIDFGANVGILDKKGHTPLCYYTNDFEDVDENIEVFRSLLKCFESLPYPPERYVENLLKTGKKKTVAAVLLSDNSVVKRIVKSIKQNKSLLMLLIRNENSEVLNVFIELEIRLNGNHFTSKEDNALMIAIRAGCPKRVEFLLKHGADVNLMPCRGRPAISDVSEYRPEVMELLLQYGADPQYYFHQNTLNVISPLNKIILAQLAILETRMQYSRSIATLLKIQSNVQVLKYFKLCMKELEELKNVKINDKITLCELLTLNKEKLFIYVRNPEIISEFERIIDNFPNDESCYLNKLKIRVPRLMAEVKLQEKAAQVIEKLTGLCSDTYRHIVFQIISYLSLQDFNNLFDISDDLNF